MSRLSQMAIVATLLSSAIGTELGHLLGSGHSRHAEFGGSKMERTYIAYKGLPVGEDALKAAGWHKHGTTCNPDLGFAWTEKACGATKAHPMKLYTTAGGQPAGVGIIILGYYGQEPLPGPQKRWATKSPLVEPRNDTNVAHIDVAFREGAIMCSGHKDADAIGNVLVVNPSASVSKSGPYHAAAHLPLTEAAAQSSRWKRGSCFDGMGWHYFYDTSLRAPHAPFSWKAANLFPVVTMYDQGGEVNAIFFASTINQVSIPFFANNEWEPKSLSDSEMCENLCDKECTFAGMTSAGPWSTAHVYFKDHTQVKCPSNLKCKMEWPIRMSCCDHNHTSDPDVVV